MKSLLTHASRLSKSIDRKIDSFFDFFVFNPFRVLSGALLVVLVFFFISSAHAVEPNPGHLWTEIGDGTFAVTGPTSFHTYTFPDATSTVLTTNAAVTVAQGGTGAATLTGVVIGNGTSAFTAVTAPASAIAGISDTQTLTNKTISYANNTLTGVASSGANSNITSLTGLTTPLTVAQGGTGAATYAANSLLVGNTTSAFQTIAPSTAGNILQSNGTSWTSASATNPVFFTPVGLSVVSLSTVSALTTGTTYFEYMGVAPKTYSSCSIRQDVTTAAATITYAEVGIFQGTPVIASTASLSRLGYTSVAATYNTTGLKTTVVTASIVAGENIWVAFGSSATTPFQVSGTLADQLQTGVFQTGSVRPSTAAVPFTTTLAAAAAVPGWVVMTCS